VRRANIFFVLFVLLLVLLPPVLAEGETFTVWIFSDVQHALGDDCQAAGNTADGQLDDVRWDLNNHSLPWDIAFFAGDIAPEAPAAECAYCEECWYEGCEYYLNYTNNLSLHNHSYIFEIPGNHEIQQHDCKSNYTDYLNNAVSEEWFNISTRTWFPENVTFDGNISWDNVSYAINTHNLAFILFAGNDYEHAALPHIMEGQAAWINDTINKYNESNNTVFLIDHYGPSEYMGLPNSSTCCGAWQGCGVFNWNPWLQDQLENWYNPFALFFGHIHIDGVPIQSYYVNKTFYMDISSTNAGKTPGAGAENTNAQSVFLTFTNGSDQVNIRRRNHTSQEWMCFNTSGTTESSFGINLTLPYPFYLGGEPPVPEAPNNPPNITGEIPENGSYNVSVNIGKLSFNLTDLDGDEMTFTVESYPNVGSYSNSEYNGTKNITISTLAASTNYTWWVNVTDGEYWTNETFGFMSSNFTTSRICITYTTPGYSFITISFIGIIILVLIPGILISMWMIRKLRDT